MHMTYYISIYDSNTALGLLHPSNMGLALHKYSDILKINGLPGAAECIHIFSSQ